MYGYSHKKSIEKMRLRTERLDKVRTFDRPWCKSSEAVYLSTFAAAIVMAAAAPGGSF